MHNQEGRWETERGECEGGRREGRGEDGGRGVEGGDGSEGGEGGEVVRGGVVEREGGTPLGTSPGLICGAI